MTQTPLWRWPMSLSKPVITPRNRSLAEDLRRVAAGPRAQSGTMERGQTYRAKIIYRHVCELSGHQERTEARLLLQLRTPSDAGTWMWGAVCGVIELPEPVVQRLAQGAVPQAPTLREIRGDDGSRVAVLDVILEVPAQYVSDLDNAM